MPIQTLRPNSTISNGGWSRVPTGGTTHGILSDQSDSTYLSTTARLQLPSQFAVFDIADSSLPAGAKIYSVRINVRVMQATPPVGSTFVFDPIRFYLHFIEEVIEDIITGEIVELFKSILGFRCPNPPGGGSATWQTVSLAYALEKPSGGEWTEAALNGLTWYLGRTDSNSQLAKVAEFFVEVDYNERPTVAITAFSGDTVTDTTRPVIGWTYDDPEGDPQDAFRAKIFSEAQYSVAGFDVETSAATAEVDWTSGQGSQWLVPRDLPNGAWRAYVQVRQAWRGIGEHRSVWDSYDFTQDVPGPPPPVVVATANNTANRVQIELTAGVIDPATDPPTETYNVEYSDDAGVSWRLIRGGYQIQADESGSAICFDYTAPLNRARLYRALAYTTINTIKCASDYSEINTVTVRSNKFWLKDPLSTSSGMALSVFADAPKVTRLQTVYAPLLADGIDGYKFVVNGPPYGIEGEITFIFIGDDVNSGYERFRTLYRPGRVLLLQYPTGEQHYLSFGGEVDVEWDMRNRSVLYRKAKVTYYEQPEPPDPSIPKLAGGPGPT